MKNRRDFLKIFGTVAAAGAALVTVGMMAEGTPPVTVKPLQSRPLNAKVPVNASERVVGKEDIYDLEPKWLGGPEDQGGNLDHWRKVWAKMAHPREDLFQLTPIQREKLVDNVFQADPLLSNLWTRKNSSSTTDEFGTYTTSGTSTGGGIYTTSTTLTTSKVVEGSSGLVVGSNLENNTHE